MLIFLCTMIISFMGSLQPGPLNMSVVQLSLHDNPKGALKMNVGGCIPEFIYSLLAAEGLVIFQYYPWLLTYLQWGVVPLLLILAYFTWISKPQTHAEDLGKTPSKAHFWKGLMLSIFNPQLLPFWMIVLINYQTFSWLKVQTYPHKIAFAVGASVGAFLLNYFYSQLALKYKDQIFAKIQQETVQKWMAYIFIIMAIAQGGKLLSEW